MNDTNEVIPMGNAEWQEIVKSIPVVCDITETTAKGVVRQVLKAVFEKNGLPMDKLDAMVSTVIAHSQNDIGFAAMHGFAIPHGYVIVCSSPNHAGYRQFLARLCRCLISDDKVSRLASVSTRNDLETLLSSQ